VADLAGIVAQARNALEKQRPLDRVEGLVPDRPGLYAIHGDGNTWTGLGLGKPPNDRPLYVGKAEDSLVARDVKTHFGDGRTGQSTVRRSFAALLHDELGLRGIPRNTAKPGYYSNYGLSAAHDAVLTRWMRERLMLAVWSKPDGCTYALAAIEAVLLAKWQPPLNLQGIVTPWTPRLKSARAAMAEEARTWEPRSR
jgi:GIY-YIG catalytic domain